MKKFFIITNKSRDEELVKTAEVERAIVSCGGIVTGRVSRLAQDDASCYERVLAKIPDDTECIVTLGGDGTMLRAARTLYTRALPFLGINLGNLGYLTEGSGCSAEELFAHIINDDYVIERRMLVKGSVIRGGTEIETRTALNDITLNRSQSLRIINFNLYVNGEFLYNYRADGIIVSTPTGSTAYNLSCGGPVVEPTARLLLITPIAPHSLNNRSLVLSAEDTVELEILSSEKDPDQQIEYVAYFDSDAKLDLQPGDRIRISAADKDAGLVRQSRRSFLETLRAKLS